jgi:ABC-type Na+ efflux pump permease subunit
MTKVWLIAVREFVATVFTKGFIIGLLVVPVLGAIVALVMPRLFANRDFLIEGQVAIIDSTGVVARRAGEGMAERRSATAISAIVDRARAGGANNAVIDAISSTTRLTLVERGASADVEQAKLWLNEEEPSAAPHVALIVVHGDAVSPPAGEATFGNYDLYVPPRQDDRIEIAVQSVMRDAIIDARVAARGLDRVELTSLTTVPRVDSVTIGADGERDTVFGVGFIVPIVFMSLLIIGVMFGGQGLLTTTVEEKSNRVIEVLLSAVSPVELMGGKLLGHMGISLLAMSLYLGMGLTVLAAFSLFGELDLLLILYLLIFFLIAFFTIGSLMMAIGAAVNDMREAQSLMMPLMFVMMVPWFLMMPIARDPNSTLAVVVSFVPPLNSFGMLLRLGSSTPPPAWQVWLSIGVGAAAAYGALWMAAKVFRVGLLMFGKPPDLKTLIRWIRAA